MIRGLALSILVALAFVCCGCALPPGPLTGLLDGWNNNTSNAPRSNGYYSPVTRS